MSDGVMIAFLPVEASWVKQSYPHMTLVYAGTIDDNDPSALNEMAKDAISASRLMGGRFSLVVTGVEEWGDENERVDVLMLYPNPALLLARRLVERWNKSSHSEFKPHVTIGPAGTAFAMQTDPDSPDPRYGPITDWNRGLPGNVYFNRIAVSWGEKTLTFNLPDLY